VPISPPFFYRTTFWVQKMKFCNNWITKDHIRFYPFSFALSKIKARFATNLQDGLFAKAEALRVGTNI